MALLITQPVGIRLTSSLDIDFTARRLGWATGLEGFVQNVTLKLRLIRGELFWNLNKGVPWLYRAEEISIGWPGVPKAQALLGQKFSPEKTRAAFRPAILSTPGCRDITAMPIAFNTRTRLLEVEWTARTIWGDAKDLFTRSL